MTNIELEVEGLAFKLVCRIDPHRESDGQKIQEFMPQQRFNNVGKKPLNRYGAGPFCKFSVARNLSLEGVYLITVDGGVKYIGESENVSQRFSQAGYGSIQPRNCFVGGQATNCKINNLILKNSRVDRDLQLWFHETADHKPVEARLIQTLRPEWNGKT